jgi:uracil-DNA glycosylase
VSDRDDLVADAAAYARFLAESGGPLGVPREWMPEAVPARVAAPGSRPRPAAPARPSEPLAPPVPVPALTVVASPLVEMSPELAQVRAELGECTRCGLHKTRKNIVFGQGNPHARLMFVGEAPGADEDEQGLAFVGRAGQLLTDIIEKGFRLKRSDVYIANILKSRPPGNRNPEPDEVLACAPFLEAQIAAIKPEVIVGLGKFAAHWLLKTAEPITRLRGKMGEFNGVRVMPTYHPAYLLRNPSAKKEVWDDVKTVLGVLESA